MGLLTGQNILNQSGSFSYILTYLKTSRLSIRNRASGLNIQERFLGIRGEFRGAFFGATFAFIFFIIEDRYSRKRSKRIEWEKTYKKEHAHLERYLNNLRLNINTNKGILLTMIKSYKEKKMSLIKLKTLPTKEDISMKLDDQIFINKIETYLGTNIERINDRQDAINDIKTKVGEYLIEGNQEKRAMAENMLPALVSDREVLVKTYDYQLEATEDLLIENRVLLKKYKSRKYEANKFRKTLETRNLQVEKEKAIGNGGDNPIRQEQIDRLKKFGLYKE